MPVVPQRIGGDDSAPDVGPDYLLMAKATGYKDNVFKDDPIGEVGKSPFPASKRMIENSRTFDENRPIKKYDPSQPHLPGNPVMDPSTGKVGPGVKKDTSDQVAGGSEEVWNSIYQQESSSGKNTSTSHTGAKGPGQIMPGTWKEWAKPGENIDNKDDNIRVSKRIVESYHNKYGGDPARVAVAYFSGPGNVAPEGSPTPWKVDKSDARPGHKGTTTSQYVAQVTGRMGEGGGTQMASAEGAVRGHSEGTSMKSIIGDDETFIAKHGVEGGLQKIAEMQKELNAYHERIKKRQKETA